MRNKFKKLAMVPYTFVMMNWAAVAGLYYFTRGSVGMWGPKRLRNA